MINIIVPPSGPLTAKIAFIGEAPGSKERERLEPFIGPAGVELSKLCHSAGIVRAECYITNVIKEQPPGNNIAKFIDLSKKVPIITKEAQLYIEHLKEELEQCQANVLVPLGNTALYVLTGQTSILKWRGSILNSTLLPGRKVVPTIHPRAVLPPTGVYLWHYWIISDLRRAKEESQFPELRLPAMHLITRPSFSDAKNFLLECLTKPVVDVDIEVLREEVSCIAFAYNQHEAISIPFVDESGDYFTIDQEGEIWTLIAEILQNPNILKRGQNFLFDVSFLLNRLGIRTVNVQDTMIAQGILYPDFPKGLDFITSSYTRIPYYKDEGKKWSRLGGNWTQHWEYNAKDVMATAQAWPELEAQVIRQGNAPTVTRQTRMIEPLSFMQQRGIKMDTESMEMAQASITKELERLTNQFYSLCQAEINPNSPKQLKEYFYGLRGFKPYKNRKTGSDSVDSDALKRLSRKGVREATILLEIRRLGKLKGTYLDVQLDSDRRLRCSFNPVGTESGRLSSSKTIFGTGTNLQNQPVEMKRFMLFDQDYAGYNIDLSQAENRIVAYVGPVPEMIKAFELGMDVHSLTAALIFSEPMEKIKDEDKLGVPCDLGDASHTKRFWGKKANHGLNYDLGFRSFSLYYEIPERDAKFITDRYHLAYPGVRQGYHTQVRDMLSRNRTIINCMGRRRLFLDRWGDQLFKDAYAQIPQSTVADIINERGVEYIYYDQVNFGWVELLLQVHDSIVFQIPLSIPWSEHARILIKIKESLETPIEWKTRQFSIPCDLQMSLGHMAKGSGGLTDIKREYTSNRDILTRELERIARSLHRETN